MRALVLATRYLGVGGIETYTRSLVRALTEEIPADVLSFLAGEREVESFPGLYLGDHGQHPTTPAKIRFAIEALGRARHYDLVICGHVALAPLGLVLHRLFHIPFIVVGHGMEVWRPLSPLCRMALRSASRIIAVSNYTGGMIARVQGVPPDRISIVHPGVDPALYELADGPHKSNQSVPTILSVARLSSGARHKGIETLIRALPSAIREAGPAHCVIVGDGDDRTRLETLTDSLGLNAVIRFAGRVATPVLADCYRSADIFAMPSALVPGPSGHAGEGFGIVYIEAAAFGLPVIGGHDGGTPEAVVDGVTGLLIDDHDPDEMSEALARLLRDRQLRVRFGTSGRNRVRELFTFSRFKEKVVGVVRSTHGDASLKEHHTGWRRSRKP